MHILNKRWKLINYISPPWKFPSFLTLRLLVLQSDSSKVLLVEDAVALLKVVWKEQVTLIFLIVSLPNPGYTETHAGAFPASSSATKESPPGLLSFHLTTLVLTMSTGHSNSLHLWQGLETRVRGKSETLHELNFPFVFLFVAGTS